MTKPLDIVVLGLSLSSSWGNGHATTYRALLKGLDAEGHRLLFLERDVPWYAQNRDLATPGFCALSFYRDVPDLLARFSNRLASADAVVVGSYLPDGVRIIDALHALRSEGLCFYDIDTPVTLAKLDRADETYLARRQIPGFDLYLSFTGGPVLERLERVYHARRAIALYCSVDAESYRHSGEAACWDLGYLGTYSEDRQPVLERLLIEPARRLPQMRFVVAGPQYPATIDWPGNVERIEHLPPAQHASFYSRQRFTLNVTRADMVAAGWSPSVRLFEAAACQAPLISDFWRGLDELFGTAVVVADDASDVVRALTTINEPRRQDLAARARACVLRRHTGQVRARELASALRCLDRREKQRLSWQSRQAQV